MIEVYSDAAGTDALVFVPQVRLLLLQAREEGQRRSALWKTTEEQNG